MSPGVALVVLAMLALAAVLPLLSLLAMSVHACARLAFQWWRAARTMVGTSANPGERAEELLRELLDEREYRQLKRRGYLDVVSPTDARRIYRIPRFYGRVRVYEGGQAVLDLCVQPAEPLPSADVVAMHKLMIQGDEHEYLARANQFPFTSIFPSQSNLP